MPQEREHTLVKIPTTSKPAFSSTFGWGWRIQEHLGRVLDITGIQFSVSDASCGLNGTETWWSTIMLYNNGQPVQTIYNESVIIEPRLFASTKDNRDRAIAGWTAGTSSTRFLPITNTFTKSGRYVHVLPNLEVKITMRPVGDCGTNSAATINSAFLCCRATYAGLPAKGPQPIHFLNQQMGTWTVASGSTSFSTVLTPLAGNVTALAFFLLPITGNYAANAHGLGTTAGVSSFDLKGEGGNSVTGGVMTVDEYNQLYSYRSIGYSTLPQEIFCYSFTPFARASSVVGGAWGSQPFSYRRFTGRETLVVNFDSALGQAFTLVALAYTPKVF